MTDLQTLMTQAARDREPLDTPPFELLVDRARARGRRRLAGWGAGMLVAAAAGAVVIPQLGHRTPAQPGGPSAGGSTAQGTEATVTGVLTMVGGPAGAAATPVRGTVTLTASSTAEGTGYGYSVSVLPDGRFTVSVQPGKYTITGTSPDYFSGTMTCLATDLLDVSARSVTEVTVACQRR